MKKFNFKNRKHIALSLVAFILIMLMTAGVTYSWIDDAKQVQISTVDDAKNKTPLKTGVDINAKVSVTKKNNTINLGNILDLNENDTKYTEDGKSHLRYDSTKDSRKKYDKDTINQKKGYFYESGDMHLSGCYSDGEYFYFPKSNGSYREGNKDDENVNYISFTTQVSSPNANVDFWFKNQPKIYKHGTNTAISQARYAISVDGQSHVYSSSGSAATCSVDSSGTPTGTKSVSGVRETSVYTYGNDDNKTDSLGKNSNVLFSIKKGDTVNVTIKIWIENSSNFDTTITASDINMELVSSWAYPRKITIYDKTTDPSGASWIGHNSATLYLTFPEFLKDRDSDPTTWLSKKTSNTDANVDYPIYELTRQGTAGSYYYEVDVPDVYNNEEMILYRCTDKGWDQEETEDSDADKAVIRGPKKDGEFVYSVYCWNWWRTYSPNTYEDAEYTLYGSSLDKSANDAGFINESAVTNKGYGTWGGVDKIEVYPYTVSGTCTNNYSYKTDTNWASKDDGKVYISDYSDSDTSKEIYYFGMYGTNYTENNSTKTKWEAYVPKSSALLKFTYLNNSNQWQGQWGYNTWTNKGTCPQQRPLKTTGLYASNSTKYYLTANDSDTTHKDQGRGFWENANCCYLIKAGWLANSGDPFARMWWIGINGNNNNLSQNANHPGQTMTSIGLNYVDSSYTSPVFKTGDINPKGFKDLNFIYNYNNSAGDSSNNLVVFAGCFYLPGGTKDSGTWLGSLTDTGRSAAGSETASGDDSGFTVQLNGNTYTVYTNSSESEFKVRLPLTAGNNWTTFQKNSLNYGLNASGQEYSVPKSSGLNIYLVKGISNNISLKASSAGNYIVTFTYDNGNTNTIKIDSAVIES